MQICSDVYFSLFLKFTGLWLFMYLKLMKNSNWLYEAFAYYIFVLWSLSKSDDALPFKSFLHIFWPEQDSKNVAKICLAAPSNAAADELLLRLVKKKNENGLKCKHNILSLYIWEDFV